MKTYQSLLCVLASCVALTSFASAAEASEFDPNAITNKKIAEFFKAEGFSNQEKESHYSFKYHGKTYVFWKSRNEYFITLGYYADSGDDAKREVLLELCNKFNENRSVLKFAVDDDNDLSVTYETIVDKDFNVALITLMLSALDASIDEFIEEYNEATK